MGDLEWTNELAIQLVQELEKRPELWNPKHELYRVHTLKYESWAELARTFSVDIADLRKKLNSLFASHRREKARVRNGERSSWFLYPHLAFLPTHVEASTGAAPRKRANAKKPPVPKQRLPGPPVKERAPPTSDDDVGMEFNDDDDDGDAHEQLDDDDDALVPDDDDDDDDDVLVKEEPVQEHHKPRPRYSPPRRSPITKPFRRRRPREMQISSVRYRQTIDQKLNETVKLLRKSELTRHKDECDSFAKYIADSLRKHDERTQAMIKQAINNILFEQEMKKYNATQQYTVVLGLDDNPLILETDEK